jgi:hypothetical protein
MSYEYGKRYISYSWALDAIPRLHNTLLYHQEENPSFSHLLKKELCAISLPCLHLIILKYYGTSDTDFIYTHYLQLHRPIELENYVTILKKNGFKKSALNLVYIEEKKNTPVLKVSSDEMKLLTILKDNSDCMNALFNISIMQFHGMYSGLKVDAKTAHILALLAFKAGCKDAALFLATIECSKPFQSLNIVPKFCRPEEFIHLSCLSDPLYPLWRQSEFCISNRLDYNRPNVHQIEDALKIAKLRASKNCIISLILLANWYFTEGQTSSSGCCWGSRAPTHSESQIQNMIVANKYFFEAARQGSVIAQYDFPYALQNGFAPTYPVYHSNEYVNLLDDCLVWLRRASDQGYDMNAEAGGKAWRLLSFDTPRSNSKDAAKLIKFDWR